MTISPDVQPENDPGRITQLRPASDPDSPASTSPAAKILWIALLVLFGIAGVYLLVVLFSVVVGFFSGDSAPTEPAAQPQQVAPAESG